MAKAKDYTSTNNSLRQESVDIWGGQLTTAENDELRAIKKEKIEKIDIFKIIPDPTQPRRALPSTIRSAWDGQPSSLTTLFRDWLIWAENGGWAEIIRAVLEGNEIERPEQVPAEIAALLEIAGLAASIRRDGLMNPLTLAKSGDTYQIESGERRWLAFHLLNTSYEDPQQWKQIPARLVEKVSRWRQAAENNARADLNAIGKARQFAVLLMDLLTAEGVTFVPIDAFENEQAFYAQVADGDTYRIPRGKGELLLNAMGLKNSVQLRQYRSLLRLPLEMWQMADDENWGETRVRQLLNGDTVSQLTVSDDEPPSPTMIDGNEIIDNEPESEIGQGDKPIVDPFARFIARAAKNAKKLERPVLENRVNQLEELLTQLRLELSRKQ